VTQRPVTPPTLTEVIDLSDRAMAPTEPLPLAPDSMPLEDVGSAAKAPLTAPTLADLDAALVASIVEALRPRLHSWLEVEVRLAVAKSMPTLSERLAATLRDELDGKLPGLVQHALAEARRVRLDR